MGSDQTFVDYICEQADLGEALTFRKMFGEYALYLDGKVVALVCDNQLFVKPTAEGRDILGEVTEGPPYPGAKPQLRVTDQLDDREVMKRLFLATAEALPPPKPKRTKGPKGSKSPKSRTKKGRQ